MDEGSLGLLASESSTSAPFLCSIAAFCGSGTTRTETCHQHYKYLISSGWIFNLSDSQYVFDILPCVGPPTCPFSRPLTCAWSLIAFWMKKTWSIGHYNSSYNLQNIYIYIYIRIFHLKLKILSSFTHPNLSCMIYFPKCPCPYIMRGD